MAKQQCGPQGPEQDMAINLVGFLFASYIPGLTPEKV